MCAAVAALARGNPDEAAHILEDARPDLPRIGGSHAQREVFEDTLIVAGIRAGRRDEALALLRARLERRPSRRDQEWLQRCSPS